MIPIVLNNAGYTGPEQTSLPCCNTEAGFLQSIDRKSVSPSLAAAFTLHNQNRDMSKNGYLQNTGIVLLTQGGGFYLSIVIQNIKAIQCFCE